MLIYQDYINSSKELLIPDTFTKNAVIQIESDHPDTWDIAGYSKQLVQYSGIGLTVVASFKIFWYPTRIANISQPFRITFIPVRYLRAQTIIKVYEIDL